MKNEKAVYKLNFDCGRMGDLDGLFIAKKSDVKTLIDSEIEVYFGEVLGKHSEVYGNVEKSEVEMVSDEKSVIDVIEKYKLCNGFDPFCQTSINFDFDQIKLPDGECGDDMTIGEIVDILNK